MYLLVPKHSSVFLSNLIQTLSCDVAVDWPRFFPTQWNWSNEKNVFYPFNLGDALQ
jgi:hypothetical protein